jgi:hypothetical protein
MCALQRSTEGGALGGGAAGVRRRGVGMASGRKIYGFRESRSYRNMEQARARDQRYRSRVYQRQKPWLG